MTTSLDTFSLALPVRMFNSVGQALTPLKLTLLSLDPDTLIAEAVRQTGLDDWGEPAFLRDYRTFLEALAGNDQLTMVGRIAMRMEALRVLTNRLYHQAYIKQQPAVLDQPVERPLFILGLPRTGTTLLHNLLAQDPAMRVTPYWQMLHPVPASATRQRQHIRYAQNLVRGFYFMAPVMRVMHPMSAYDPEECVFLLPHHLVNHGRADLPDYVRWFLKHDLTPDYHYYRQQLQVIQQPGRHMVMKSPFHMFTPDVLLKTFPDARIIQTHRDPAKTIASWASFMTVIGAIHRRQVNPAHIAHDWLDLWQTAMQRMMQFRQSSPAEQSFDLHYADFKANPISMMQRVYAQLGYEFTQEIEERMRQWLAVNGQIKHGVHRYDPAQFGLTTDGIRRDFQAYIDYFQVAIE